MAQEKQDTFIAEPRDDFGKGYARRLRAAGRVPAVIYGHGKAPVHVSLDGHDATLAVRSANALMNISIKGKKQLTVAKEVQRHPVRRTVDHLDLLIVKAGEKITVEVTVAVTGQTQPGTIVQLENQHVAIEAEATHLPEELNVDVTDCGDGTRIFAGDVELPRGVSLVTDPEALVAAVVEPKVTEEKKAEEETAGLEGEEAAESGEDGESEAKPSETESDD